MPPPQKPGKKTCCNCGGDHKVNYCPKPNTEDGRLQVCFECDTTAHAWFTCEKYVPDFKQEYFRIWACRMGLCCIVHDKAAHSLWTTFVTTEPAESKGNIAYELPGPLTPEFVLKMLDSSKNYAEIKQQLNHGRVLPWNLDSLSLPINAERIKKVVLDPATQRMTEYVVLKGTKTTKDDVIKLTAARSTMALASDVDMAGTDGIARPNPRKPTSLASLGGTNLLSKKPSINKDIAFVEPPSPYLPNNLCWNCNKYGHLYKDCPRPCSQCHGAIGGSYHRDVSQGQLCTSRCWCGEDADHPNYSCQRPCRRCIITGRFDPRLISTCYDHCPVHPGGGEGSHDLCMDDLYGYCKMCDRRYRHWPQDCPLWLHGFCPRGDCMQRNCQKHCQSCGFESLVSPHMFQTLKDKYGFSETALPDLTKISDFWHGKIHRTWRRVDTGDLSGDKPWSIIQCNEHPSVQLKIEDLGQIRTNTLELVSLKLKDDPDASQECYKGLILPECPECLALEIGVKGDYTA